MGLTRDISIGLVGLVGLEKSVCAAPVGLTRDISIGLVGLEKSVCFYRKSSDLPDREH